MQKRISVFGDRRHSHFHSHNRLPNQPKNQHQYLQEELIFQPPSPTSKVSHVSFINPQSSDRNWRHLIRTEVSQYYDQLQRQKSQLSNPNIQNPSNKNILNGFHLTQQYLNDDKKNNKNLSNGNSPTKQSTRQLQQNKLEQLRSEYQQKISVLEHQNQNLKQQLFYLRSAIMSKYENK